MSPSGYARLVATPAAVSLLPASERSTIAYTTLAASAAVVSAAMSPSSQRLLTIPRTSLWKSTTRPM